MNTTRADYTTPEWNTLQTAVVGVGFYVRKLTPNFFDSWRTKHAAEETVEETEEESDELFFKQLCDIDDFKSYIPKHVPRTAQGVETPVLTAIEASLHILEEKDPHVLPAFKNLLLEIAHETADEVDGISPKEQEAITKIVKVINGELTYNDSWRMAEHFSDLITPDY